MDCQKNQRWTSFTSRFSYVKWNFIRSSKEVPNITWVNTGSPMASKTLLLLLFTFCRYLRTERYELGNFHDKLKSQNKYHINGQSSKTCKKDLIEFLEQTCFCEWYKKCLKLITTVVGCTIRLKYILYLVPCYYFGAIPIPV